MRESNCSEPTNSLAIFSPHQPPALLQRIIPLYPSSFRLPSAHGDLQRYPFIRPALTMSLRLPSTFRFGAIPRGSFHQPCFQLHLCKPHGLTAFSLGINDIKKIRRSISTLSSMRVLLRGTSGQLSRPHPRHSFLPVVRRPFSTSRSTFIRQTYFPTAQGGRGGPSRGSLIRQWQRRIDRFPPIYIVRLAFPFRDEPDT